MRHPVGACRGAPDSTCPWLEPGQPAPAVPTRAGGAVQQAGGASGQPLGKKEGRGGRVETTVYSLVTKRGCGGHQHGRPAGQQTSRASSSLASNVGEQGGGGLLQTPSGSGAWGPRVLLAVGAAG